MPPLRSPQSLLLNPAPSSSPIQQSAPSNKPRITHPAKRRKPSPPPPSTKPAQTATSQLPSPTEDSPSPSSPSSNDPSSPSSSSSSSSSSTTGSRSRSQSRSPTPTPPLSARLSTFLPRLAAANAALAQQLRSGDLKRGAVEVCTVDEGDEERGSYGGTEGEEDGESEAEGWGPYVEMNLGLGVLEEKRAGARSSSNSSSSSSSSSGDEQEDQTDTGVDSPLANRSRPVVHYEDHDAVVGLQEEAPPRAAQGIHDARATVSRGGHKRKSSEQDVLGKLMGKKRRIGRAMIQVVGGPEE